MRLKSIVLLIFAFCMVTSLSACGNNQAPDKQQESSDAARVTYTEDDIPKNSRENQEYVDKYMYPFAVTSLFRCNFAPYKMSELDIYMKSIFNAFYNHDYPDNELKLTDYDTEVPGDIFENTLMAHLDLTQEQIRKACAEYYDADKKVYTASFGLGGGPVEFIITDSILEDGILSLSYDFFGGDYDNPTDEFRWLLYEYGKLQIEINGDSYKFISNTLRKGPGID